MRNRLIQKIRDKERAKKKIFCAFLTYGYPNAGATARLIRSFEKEGVDIIEIGFPFSDPMADGPTIQYSSEQALKRRIRIQDVFRQTARLRREGVKVPLVFFTYLNPIFHYGLKRFARDAARAGLDAVLVPDLPPEEEKVFGAECRKQNLAQVFLIAPTTQRKRAAMIAKRTEGFIYYVSLRGVTGARKQMSADIAPVLRRLNRMTTKPVLVGFGVSQPDQARRLAGLSQGVIVGSAIIEAIRRNNGRIEPAVAFVRRMAKALAKPGR